MLLLEFFFQTKVTTQTSHYKRKPHNEPIKAKTTKMALSDGLTVECICFDRSESENRKETQNYFRQSTEKAYQYNDKGSNSREITEMNIF